MIPEADPTRLLNEMIARQSMFAAIMYFMLAACILVGGAVVLVAINTPWIWQ